MLTLVDLLARVWSRLSEEEIGTTPLSGQELLLTFVAGGLVLVAAEIEKIWVRWRLRQAPALQGIASGAD